MEGFREGAFEQPQRRFHREGAYALVKMLLVDVFSPRAKFGGRDAPHAFVRTIMLDISQAISPTHPELNVWIASSRGHGKSGVLAISGYLVQSPFVRLFAVSL